MDVALLRAILMLGQGWQVEPSEVQGSPSGWSLDVWVEDELFHDVPDDELSGTITTMSHTCLCHGLWNNI